MGNKAEQLCRFFSTVARRKGIEKIIAGFYLVSDDKILTFDGDVPIIEATGSCEDAIRIVSKEYGIRNFRVGDWIDRIEENDHFRLNFTAFGEPTKGKWIDHKNLPRKMKKTWKVYLEKQKKEV